MMCPHEIYEVKGYHLEDYFGEEWKEKYEQGESERGELKAKLEAAERRITDLESRNRKGKR